jgi:tetratricopeptide (TPR) repeat protein
MRRSLAGREPLPVYERTRRMQLLARGLILSGDPAAAIAELERAERELTAVLGVDSIALVAILNTMIEPLDDLGRSDEAIARGQRALALLDATSGKDNPRRTKILNNLAAAYNEHGNQQRAIELGEQALRIEQRTLGDEHHSVAISHVNLAGYLLEAGELDRAREHAERALTIFTKTVGPDNPVVANVHSVLYDVNVRQGHPAEGLAHAQRALAISEAAALGPADLAYFRLEDAQALLEVGRATEAIVMAKRALELPLSKIGHEGELVTRLKTLIDKATKRRSKP